MTAPFFPPTQGADATAVRPPNAPPYRTPPSLVPGNSYGTPPEPPPSAWQTIQHLPVVGRDAADQFRADAGQAWQGIKERVAGYKAPTAIPVAGLALGALNATPLAEEEALSQGAKRALDALGDVANGTSKTLPKFAILSADREGLLPGVLKERHAATADLIRDAGHEPIEHKGGLWVNDAGKRIKERGYIVPGMEPAQAVHTGARLGQSAVITNEGYHDVASGMTAPFKDAGKPVGKEPYTVLPNGKKLALRFDFENMRPTSTPEPGAISQGGAPGSGDLQQVGAAYRASAGLSHQPLPLVGRVSPASGRMMSNAYEALRSTPTDPATRAAYAKFVQETQSQAQALKNAGYSWTVVDKDPYPNSAAMLKDLRENKHINVLRTSGEGHPLMSNAENDEFRAVHDILGHGTGGHSFGPLGEENAYRQHSALYSPEAQRALATETRGQNSWFNFGPHASLPVKSRPFAAQKAALFPEHLTGEYEPTLPQGAPSVLGYPERHGLPLAREDAVGLGVSGRYLLQDFPKKAAWLERMKAMHPAYAPHLEGKAGDQAWSAATRAATPRMPPPSQTLSLAHSPEGASTRPWYHTWLPAVKQAFGEDDGEMLTRFHAILSAQKSPADNAAMSLAALRDYKAGDRSFASVGTTPERVAALQRQMDAGPQGVARMAKEGPKVNNFYLALKGQPNAVVLDRHMARAYLGHPEISDAEYPTLESRVRADAAEAGQSPRDFQAMVWGGQTKYPFESPESHLWNHLGLPATDGTALPAETRHELFTQYPNLYDAVSRHRANVATLAAPEAPSHAAIRVAGEVFETPMAQGHAGALEKAIEEMRGHPGYNTADDVMLDAEDGYTHGDGKFIPRAAVDNLHSSDFVRAKRANPRVKSTDRE